MSVVQAMLEPKKPAKIARVSHYAEQAQLDSNAKKKAGPFGAAPVSGLSAGPTNAAQRNHSFDYLRLRCFILRQHALEQGQGLL